MMNLAEQKKVAAEIQEAFRLLDLGRSLDALKIADMVAQHSLEGAGSNANLATLYVRLGHFIRGIGFYHKALQLDPDNLLTMTALASAYMYDRQYAKANSVLSRVLSVDSKCVSAMVIKGQLLLLTGNYEQAADWLKKAVDLGSLDVSAYTNLSLVKGFLGQNDKALEYAELAQSRFPGNPAVLYALAKAYVSWGRTKEAESCLKKAIKLNPSNAGSYLLLTGLRRFTRDDVDWIGRIEKELQGGLLVQNRAHFLFALGKIYDDIGEYDKAFPAFQQANRLVRQQEKPHNDAHLVKFQKKVLTRCPTLLLDDSKISEVVPVFVVGMPRSGTSLVEQIIASHPDATGAGEMIDIPVIAQQLFESCKKSGFLGRQTFNVPSPPDLLSYRERYLDVLKIKSDGRARFVVDKLPENYQFLGLIKLLFPEARIVHVKRHPLDTGLSCYFQAFETLPWSNDLAWIADTYRDYRKLMDYWYRTMPDGSIADICYESLVLDFERESKKLLNDCGLDWHPNCLKFFETKRAVNTVSVLQVRQPIYQTSTMRWVPYARYLTELAEKIPDFLTEDDFKVFERAGIKIKKSFF